MSKQLSESQKEFFRRRAIEYKNGTDEERQQLIKNTMTKMLFAWAFIMLVGSIAIVTGFWCLFSEYLFVNLVGWLGIVVGAKVVYSSYGDDGLIRYCRGAKNATEVAKRMEELGHTQSNTYQFYRALGAEFDGPRKILTIPEIMRTVYAQSVVQEELELKSLGPKIGTHGDVELFEYAIIGTNDVWLKIPMFTSTNGDPYQLFHNCAAEDTIGFIRTAPNTSGGVIFMFEQDRK